MYVYIYISFQKRKKKENASILKRQTPQGADAAPVKS